MLELRRLEGPAVSCRRLDGFACGGLALEPPSLCRMSDPLLRDAVSATSPAAVFVLIAYLAEMRNMAIWENASAVIASERPAAICQIRSTIVEEPGVPAINPNTNPPATPPR
jgi:hypothetical protein